MTLGGIFDELSPCWHIADISKKKKKKKPYSTLSSQHIPNTDY